MTKVREGHLNVVIDQKVEERVKTTTADTGNFVRNDPNKYKVTSQSHAPKIPVMVTANSNPQQMANSGDNVTASVNDSHNQSGKAWVASTTDNVKRLKTSFTTKVKMPTNTKRGGQSRSRGA